jgi:hypothetical protein
MANYPNIRLYQNSASGSKVPLPESSNSGWKTPAEFGYTFSAMCWFFGRDLYDALSTKVCVCVCVLSHWFHAAIVEVPDLPTLKFSSHWFLGLFPASVLSNEVVLYSFVALLRQGHCDTFRRAPEPS